MSEPFRLGLPARELRRYCIDWEMMAPPCEHVYVVTFVGNFYRVDSWPDKTQREYIEPAQWVRHTFRPYRKTWAEVEALAAAGLPK